VKIKDIYMIQPTSEGNRYSLETNSEKLSHFDSGGAAIMVDVSPKEETERFAAAEGFIRVNSTVMQAILEQGSAKGDVLGVARIAGIMGAKRTADLIPLAHVLPLTACTADFDADREAGTIRAVCTAKVTGKTGVEMEALTAVSIALLTIYDMCKALDRGMEMYGIRLLEKSGGRSGHYRSS
jgi:cyclic pyranopterin phosphate synthase